MLKGEMRNILSGEIDIFPPLYYEFVEVVSNSDENRIGVLAYRCKCDEA